MDAGYWPPDSECNYVTMRRMKLPTLQEIEALHKKYAPSDEVFDLVWKHCCIVRDIALQLCNNNALTLDTNLLEAGCLLHDIGVHPLFGADGKLLPDVNYITHGIEGEAILKQEGVLETNLAVRVAPHRSRPFQKRCN
jgi:uncharacterized protein